MPSDELSEQIAAPIPGDHPSGIDLRLDRSFSRFKDARKEAKETEKRSRDDLTNRNKPEKEKIPPAQSLALWRNVAELGRKTLATRTKDLDIAAFVMEAVARTEGFAGLAETFRWTRQMVENCWDTLLPPPDAEDGVEVTPDMIIEARILPLSKVSGLLAEQSRWMDITGSGDTGPYCLWQHEQALEYGKCNEEEKAIRQSRGTVTSEQFEAAVKATSDDEYRGLFKALNDCKTEFESLIETVNRKISESGIESSPHVSSVELNEALDECLRAMRFNTQNRNLEPQTTASNGDSPVTPDNPSRDPVDNVLRTREDAFRAMQQIAKFFEQTEPQSLIPAQLRRVIRLGKLSPADFFEEILEDSNDRDQLFKIHGLERKKESD